VLDFLATGLNANPNTLIRLEGHTDDTAVPYTLRRLYPDNWMLALGRTMRLMDALVNEFGMSEDRFSLASQGEFHPEGDNDTELGRAKNNRIVITLYPKGFHP
jgi:chemotaxis protein MotB